MAATPHNHTHNDSSRCSPLALRLPVLAGGRVRDRDGKTLGKGAAATHGYGGKAGRRCAMIEALAGCLGGGGGGGGQCAAEG